jgi:molybdopterin synthase catalytic subunit
MKSETIIKKIINQIDSNAEMMKNLLLELEESLEKENIKLKEDISKKISVSFDLELNQVLKKIIKKKKTSDVDASNILETIEDIEEMKDFVPIYKKIIYNDKEYYYDDKPNGVVIETLEDSSNKIVGYIDNISKNIKFM